MYSALPDADACTSPPALFPASTHCLSLQARSPCSPCCPPRRPAPRVQAKATQIFHAACRQGHFRLTVHTLDAGPAAIAAALASGGDTGCSAAVPCPSVMQRQPSGSASGSGSGSGSASPSLSLAPSLSLTGSGLLCGDAFDRVATPGLLSPASCSTPVLPTTPMGTALGVAAFPGAGSPSPTGSPLATSVSLSAAVASAVAAPGGTGAGTLIEFGMHAFTIGSAVLSLLRWVAELRERLPREPNKELKQQVRAERGLGGCFGAGRG